MKLHQNKLVNENLTLAAAIARKMNGRYSETQFDDLYGYACVGLVLAAGTFDINRNTGFKTYAWRCMLGSMVDGMRHEKVIFRVRPRNDRPVFQNPCSRKTIALDDMDGFEPVAPDPSQSIDDFLDSHKKRRTIIRAIKLLPRNMRKLIALCYFKNKTIKESGAKLKYGKSWSSRLHERALQRLAANSSLKNLMGVQG